MEQVAYLSNSNVLIHALNAASGPANALLGSTLPKERGISVITWMEVLAGVASKGRRRTEEFFKAFEVGELTPEIAERAVEICRTMRLNLPDAVIYATALVTRRRLATFDYRDFPATAPPPVHLLV